MAGEEKNEQNREKKKRIQREVEDVEKQS